MSLNFKEWLNESPVTNFQLTGKWGANDKPRGYSKQDIGILTNPKAVAKIHKKWSNTKENFDLYFVRDINASKQRETGEVTPEWVKQNLGLDIQPNEDNITVIFTSNVSGEPMTAWVIAHRLAHSLNRGRNSNFYYSFFREVEKDVNHIIKRMFPNYRPYNPYYGKDDKYPVQPIHIAYMIGTMKSARDRNVDRFDEFIYELLAQYIITGKIKFNPITPQVMLKNSMAWGRPNPKMHWSQIDKNELEDLNDYVQQMAEQYAYTLDDVFGGLIGSILVV